jgi:uncharacterized protein YndB with AHSA1/START domain
MSGCPSAQVAMERYFLHAPAKVWRALTQPWLIAEWLMANDFVEKVGSRFTLRTDPMPHWNGEVACEVLEIEPDARLVYAWNTEAHDGSPGLRTIVIFTLSAQGNGTLLRVEQSGFRADQPDNLRGAQFGWRRNFDRLLAALDAQD